MKYLKVIVGLLMLQVSAHSFAQFLPDNSSLNLVSVQRWMESNRDFSAVVQALDAMNDSEDAVKKFDALPAITQDQKINAYLQQQKLLEQANTIAARHGWKSVGEYMRFSTRLGNAIAAFFFNEKVTKLSESQRKAVREKTDPVILAVPEADVAFVKTNEPLLKEYIQAYAKGR